MPLFHSWYWRFVFSISFLISLARGLSVLKIILHFWSPILANWVYCAKIIPHQRKRGTQEAVYWCLLNEPVNKKKKNTDFCTLSPFIITLLDITHFLTSYLCHLVLIICNSAKLPEARLHAWQCVPRWRYREVRQVTGTVEGRNLETMEKTDGSWRHSE